MLKKILLIPLIFVSGLFLSGCSLKKTPAALKIDSVPTANVFIDGKLLGKTPYNAENLNAGEVLIKLIPETTTEAFPSWENKIKLNGGVLTLIDREFAASENNSSGHVLSLEKIKDNNSALISIVTEPDGVNVQIDGEAKGLSPLTLDKIDPGDHEIVFSKENHRGKNLKVKNVLGYRLIINAKLGQGSLETITPTPAPTLSGPTPKASPTVKVSNVSPTPKSTTGVIPTSATDQTLGYILVKENSMGFLRVRNAPSGAEIVQIKPIDPEKKYTLLEEKSGWYKIAYEEGKEGWVTADTTYTTKVSE